MHLSRILAAAAALLALAACSSAKKAAQNTGYGFPSIDQKGKVAIVAHRGFWKSEQGGMSENSIASLKAAQDAGFWGSECDIHITADDVVIVNHNKDIAGKKIATHNFADFERDLLPNGERRPTLDEYLFQTEKCSTTRLIIEFKRQPAGDREDLLVDKTIEALKAHGLYDPERVLFISFSRHICEKVAAEHPRFINQFLSSDIIGNQNPEAYAALGINGADYFYPMFASHPEWVAAAHACGMSVNAWTVDKEKDIRKMIETGVDAITSNEPLLVRRLLGDKEYR